MLWSPPGLQALSFISCELNALKEQLDLSEHCVCFFLQGMVDGDFRLPLGLAQGSPIFHSSCEGKLGVALESLQGPRDLI